MLWMKKNAHTLWWRPVRLKIPSVPEGFRVGASSCPTACHKDFGAYGASKGCSYLMVIIAVFCPMLPPRNCTNRILTGITYGSIINTLPLFKVSLLEGVAYWNPKWFPVADPTRHREHTVATMHNCQQEKVLESIERVCDMSPRNVSLFRKYAGLFLNVIKWKISRVHHRARPLDATE